MSTSPPDYILRYQAKQAETLAQLPEEVRQVLEGMPSEDGQEVILDALRDLMSHPEFHLRMKLLGTLSYAAHVGHLSPSGHKTLCNYMNSLSRA